MTVWETAYAVVLLAAAVAWPWLLAKVVANAVLRSRPAPAPMPALQVTATPTQECVVTFWNGCSIPIDKTRESDRLALASGMLLRFQWK